MRSLVQILQERHGFGATQWHHIKAHQDHPWNELVDRIAKHASCGGLAIANCEPWQTWLREPDMLLALQWVWCYEHLHKQPHDAPQLSGLMLEHRIMKPHMPNFDHPKFDQHPNDDAYAALVDIKLATVNVLSLSTITRQRVLQRQFVDEAVHFVGLQETRHKHMQDTANPDFHIIGQPATPQGHDGVQIWVTKTKSIVANGTLVQLKHLTIVMSTPQCLVVKLCLPEWRCLLITGRAPHAGCDQHVSVRFWADLSKSIRRLARDWPVIFLGDTNGHLGIPTSSAVGCLAAVNENGPGHIFHDWLLEHQLFVPSTFADYHCGNQHATFTSANGEHESLTTLRYRQDYSLDISAPLSPTTSTSACNAKIIEFLSVTSRLTSLFMVVEFADVNTPR